MKVFMDVFIGKKRIRDQFVFEERGEECISFKTDRFNKVTVVYSFPNIACLQIIFFEAMLAFL